MILNAPRDYVKNVQMFSENSLVSLYQNTNATSVTFNKFSPHILIIVVCLVTSWKKKKLYVVYFFPHVCSARLYYALHMLLLLYNTFGLCKISNYTVVTLFF